LIPPWLLVDRFCPGNQGEPKKKPGVNPPGVVVVCRARPLAGKGFFQVLLDV
jgi:hypothetical protein